MPGVAVDRKKLYEQVWAVPGSRLAPAYGISDVGLAKACKRYKIPRPPRGYWARLAAGQRPRKPPLPDPRAANTIVHFEGWDMSADAIEGAVEGNRRDEVPPTSAGSAEPNPLVALTLTALREQTADAEGLVRAAPPAFDVRVSAAAVDRAASVLAALLRRWQAYGGEVRVSEASKSEGRASSALAMGADSVGVRLWENVDERKPLTDPARLTGHLALHITGHESRQFRRRWSDTKSQRLEKMFGAFVQTLLGVLDAARQERLDAECVARQEDVVRQRRRAESRDSSQEFHWRQELMQHVDRWHDAQRIRAYLAALRAASDAGRWHPADDGRFATWVGWAAAYAESIDPIVGGSLPEGQRPERRNVGVADLDLTSSARAAVTALAVADTDELWSQKQDAVRKACTGRFGRVWNELTRVLEGNGYDVAKREVASEWY